MFALSSAQRYFLYPEPTDIRKSFDGLCGIVSGRLGRDPLAGDVFVFVNRRRTHIKLLVWDRCGFLLYYRRLERGTFELPASTSNNGLTWSDLMLMLEGVSLDSARFRKRYQRPENVVV